MSKLSKMNDKNYRFRKLGGTYQLIIENSQDVKNVIDLD